MSTWFLILLATIQKRDNGAKRNGTVDFDGQGYKAWSTTASRVSRLKPDLA